MTTEELALKISGDSKDAQNAVLELVTRITEAKSAAHDAEGGFANLGSEVLTAAKGMALGALGASSVEQALETVVEISKEALEILPQLVERVAATGERILSMSQMTGIAVGPLSDLRIAAKLAGVEFDQLTNALFMLERNMGQDKKTFEAGLHGLGMTLEYFESLKPDQRILAISDAFRALPPEANKAQIAFELFNRQGRDMLPMLLRNMRELTDQAHDLGVTYSEEDVRASRDFDHALMLLEERVEAVGTKIGKALLPQVAHYADALLDNKTVTIGLQVATEGLIVLLDQMVAKVKLGGSILLWLMPRELADMVEKITGAFGEMARQMEVTKRTYSEYQTAAQAAEKDTPTQTAVIKDFRSELKETEAAVAHLTSAQWGNIVAGKTLNHSIEEIAKATGLSAEVIHLAIEQHTKAEEAAKKHAAALREITSSMDTLSEATRAEIAERLKDHESEANIAEALHVTEQQVKQVAAAEAFRTKVLDALDKLGTKIWENELKRAQEKAQKLVELVTLEQAAADREAQIGMTGLALKLYQINTAWEAESKKLRLLGDETSAVYVKAKAETDAYYNHLTDLAVGTSNTIVERMHAAGVETVYELGFAAMAARDDYDAMRQSGVYSADQIEAALQKVIAAEHAAGNYAYGLGHILKISLEDALGSLPQTIISALTGGGGWAGALQAAASQVGSAVGGDIGYAIGGKLGQQIGAALGSMLGLLVKTFADMFRTPEWVKAERDIGNEIGGNISHAMADAIASKEDELIKLLLGSDSALADASSDFKNMVRHWAEAISLPDIIADQGGLTSQNLDQWIDQSHRLFEVIRVGGQVGAQGVKALSTLIGQFAAQAETSGGLWDAAFKKLLSDALLTGAAVSDVMALIKGQQDKLGAAASRFAADVAGDLEYEFDAATKKVLQSYDDQIAAVKDLKLSTEDAAALTKKLEDEKAAYIKSKNAEIVANNQDQFDRASRILMNAFNTLVASGVSPLDAMNDLGDGFDKLIADADRFGFSGNKAFEDLKRWRELTVAFKPVLDEIADLNTIMVTTANLGGLTQDAFDDLEKQGTAAYNKLIAGGMTQAEAELAEKQYLLNVIKAHKENGVAIDEETHKRIDAAKAAGIIGDDEESTNDILKEGLGAIIKLLGGELPESWKQMAKAAKEATDAVQDQAKATKKTLDQTLGQLNYKIHLGYDDGSGKGGTGGGGTPGSGGDNAPPPPAFGTEAYVRRPTIAMLGETPEFVLKPGTLAKWMSIAAAGGASSGSGSLDALTAGAAAADSLSGGASPLGGVHFHNHSMFADVDGIRRAMPDLIGPEFLQYLARNPWGQTFLKTRVINRG